jgi:hypothetical protein
LRHSAGKGFDEAQKCRQLWQRRQQAVYALQTFADFGSGDGGFLSLQSVQSVQQTGTGLGDGSQLLVRPPSLCR